MSENGETPSTDYPLGRGYGHDYMRGGEVFGGYGYSERQEYELRRGELSPTRPEASSSTDGASTPGGEERSPEAGGSGAGGILPS